MVPTRTVVSQVFYIRGGQQAASRAALRTGFGGFKSRARVRLQPKATLERLLASASGFTPCHAVPSSDSHAQVYCGVLTHVATIDQASERLCR
jgi:hypothetical protein